jgi:hypothetical protein
MGEGAWLGQGGGLERPSTMSVEGGLDLLSCWSLVSLGLTWGFLVSTWVGRQRESGGGSTWIGVGAMEEFEVGLLLLPLWLLLLLLPLLLLPS